jgi:polar amino acid transport system substrate-binding protein
MLGLLLFWQSQSSFANELKALDSRKITLVSDHWQPFYGPDLKDGGYMIEICKAAFAAVDYQLTVKLMPWKRAVKAAELGIYDGLLGAYYTQKRAKIYHYSQSLAQEQTVLVALDSQNLAFNSTADLTDYSIGVMRGAVNSTELDEAQNLTFSYSNDASHNLKKLLIGRVDYMVTGKAHLDFIISHEYKGDIAKLKVFSPALKTNDIYITLLKRLKNSQHIMSDFNQGMQIIKANGVYQAIKEKHFRSVVIATDSLKK